MTSHFYKRPFQIKDPSHSEKIRLGILVDKYKDNAIIKYITEILYFL